MIQLWISNFCRENKQKIRDIFFRSVSNLHLNVISFNKVLFCSNLCFTFFLIVVFFFPDRFLRLKPFSGDEGSWMIMFFVTILCLFLFSYIYNLFLLAGGEGTEPYRISSLMGISNATFMRMAACGTWLGDLFTAWMVSFDAPKIFSFSQFRWKL